MPVYLISSKMEKGAIYAALVMTILVLEGLLIGLFQKSKCEPSGETTETVTTRPMSDVHPTTSASTGPWTNVRLPDNLVPIKYNVELRPVLTMNAAGIYVFFGNSTVTYECRKPTNYVIMHSLKLHYTELDITITTEGNPVEVKELTFYQPNEFMIVETNEPCIEGRIYELTVSEFFSELSGDLTGLYRSEYVTSSGVRKVIAASLMSPTGARETFPCFDEPALKANFTVTLWYRANTGEFALSNMPPRSHKLAVFNGEPWNSTTFEETVPISTYLLALVVCDFPFIESFSSKGIQTRTYARKEVMDNREAEYAALITPQILDFLEDYFDVAYPLPKSDQIAVPDFGPSAMENWGLIIYQESIMLFDEKLSSVFNKKKSTIIISHELVHQWFGNLVSPAWWDDVWLKEGFATFLSYVGEKRVQPSWKSMERFLIEQTHVAMEYDGLATSHPLVQPVYSSAEISSQFDDISYSKGACVLLMVNAFMGEKNFVDGLTAYLNDLAYRAATHGDLFGHWEEQANKVGLDLPANLTVILETWTLQMGHPVVNVRKAAGTNTYAVTQDYFLFDAGAEPVHTEGSKKYGYKWYVPFTYKTFDQLGTENLSSEWMTPNGGPLRIVESEYILANVDDIGYYRVNYDENTWNKLIDHLKSDDFEVISERNRAQLLDDAFNLARPGRLDITIAMSLSQYLTQEREYVPWKTFMEGVKFIEYLIVRSPIYGMFSRYIVQLIEPTLYDKYGFEEPNVVDMAQIERMTIQLAIEGACYYGGGRCIRNASQLFRQWMVNPENSSIVSNTYRNDVYCAAIRNGGVEEWDFAWERHNASDNAQEKASLRYGMSCSKDPWILFRYLAYCIDTNYVRRQDSLRTCVRYVADGEYGRDVTWAFMTDNWDKLVDIYGTGRHLNGLIKVITRRFSTDYDLQLLQHFKKSKDNLGNIVRGVDQAIEKTKSNMQWRKLNEEKLTEWLKTNVESTV